MAVHGVARLFIEPDDQYTTISTSRDDAVVGSNLIATAQNQTLAVAFNKMRDDLASLVTGGLKVREASITIRIE